MAKLKMRFSRYLYYYLAICSLLMLFISNSFAQLPAVVSDTSNNSEVKDWPKDSLGRRTPRGTVEGFLRAAATGNYEDAALYLKLDTSLKQKQSRVKLAQALQTLLDKKGNIYPYSWISNDPAGLKDDNLGPNQDRIGASSIDGESFDLILENTKAPDGSPVWLFSSETIQRVPLDTTQIKNSTLVEKVSPKVLEDSKLGGVPLAHWLAMLVLAIVSYIVSGLLIRILVLLIPRFWHKARKESISGIIQSFVLPIQLYLAVWLFVVGSRQAGVSILIRQRLNDLTLIVGLVALLLLLWRLLDFVSGLIRRQMIHHGNLSGISAVLFLRRAAKVALVVLGVTLILDTFGINVTTWLTALGIGGIALALGTQKTVENFVGSVTLIADHPIRVGDYCKVGDIYGTVEQIGMRTTLIRTGDRTIVSITNGELSSTKIENFASRDRFLFHPVFTLRLGTPSDQVKKITFEMREVLLATPKMDPDPARVCFTEIKADSLKIEVYAYIKTADGDEFLKIQEDLLLRLMDVIKGSATGFPLPTT